MIYYATKETMQRYKLKTPDQLKAEIAPYARAIIENEQGYRFYGYIKDGILHTMQINRDVNEVPVTRKVDGKEEWLIPYEHFAETIKKHFA